MGRWAGVGIRSQVWALAGLWVLWGAVAPVSASVAACSAAWSGSGGLFGLGGLTSLLAGGSGSAASCLPGEPASVPPDEPARIAGNPVDLLTGAKIDRVIDFQPPAAADAPPALAPFPGLVFSRLYASTGQGSAAFGPGWRHGFETRLHRFEQAGEPVRYRIIQADGRVMSFAPGASSGEFVTRLREDGVLRWRGGPVPWVWLWRSGRVLGFLPDGRLHRIDAPDGAGIALRYDQLGRLATLTDTSARELHLEYASPPEDTPGRSDGAASRVRGLRLGAARLARYDYDTAGRLVAVTDAGGAQTRYRYAAPTGSRLSAVIRPDGTRSGYRYDAGGRVAELLPAGALPSAAMRFTHQVDASGESGTVRIAIAGLERARYQWTLVDGERRLVSAEGPGCVACPPTGVRYRYLAGSLAVVERSAERIEIRRDRLGRVIAAQRVVTAVDEVAGGLVAGDQPTRRSASHPVPRLMLRVQWADQGPFDLPESIHREGLVSGVMRGMHLDWDSAGRLRSIRETGQTPQLSVDAGHIRVTGFTTTARIRTGPAAAIPAARARGDMPQLPVNAQPSGGGVWIVRAPNGVATRYWLDDLDRLVATESPDSGIARWRYDTRGRLAIEQAGDGATAVYQYDDADRLVSRTVSGAQHPAVVTRYRYHGGRLASVEHPEQSESYRYDALGRLATRTVILPVGAGRQVRYQTRYLRDPVTGWLRALSLPDRSWLLHDRDAYGRLTGLRRVAATDAGDEPDPAQIDQIRSAPLLERIMRDQGHIVALRYGNLTEMSLTRDPGARVLSLCHRRQTARGSCDILDHRLEFDAHARALRWRRGAQTEHHLSGQDGELLQSRSGDPRQPMIWRQAHDANGNRLLSSVPGMAPATRTTLVAGSNRIAGRAQVGATAAVERYRWDAAGRLSQAGARRYDWTVDGLLAQVSEGGSVLARFRYNHRGERVLRQDANGVRRFLHDELRRPLAELDAAGRVLRVYIHPEASAPALPPVLVDRSATGERLVYLHANHLGAPEVATDQQGRVIWQGELAPFGRMSARSTARFLHGSQRLSHGTEGLDGAAGDPAFEQALRLPGQYEDAATGLHFNDHRYYDPDTGRYISPDPLGLRAGANPYVYAANQPLSRIDPSGLILFAFDGTGNSDPPPGLDDPTNVYKLARSYADGRVWYVAGVGRDDAASGIGGGWVDALTALSARARVDLMLARLDQAAAAPEAAGRWLDVDVIGFSRGAAMARDFVNRVASRMSAGAYSRAGACVRLRFLGLWDTVAQFGIAGSADADWQLAIPGAVAHAAHAVALNEHRLLFPAESITGSPLAGVRIERGFVGAHSDIGGGYAEGDLSDVALDWMYAQARLAGVLLRPLTSEFERVTQPLVHDSNITGLGDRAFRVHDAAGNLVSSQNQRVATVDGLRWVDTAAFIDRYAHTLRDAYGDATIIGEVEIDAYLGWLRTQYGLILAAGQ